VNLRFTLFEVAFDLLLRRGEEAAMKALSATLVVLASLASSAGRAAELDKQATIATALSAFADCMTDATIRLDDGHSDAATVADAALERCSYEEQMAKLKIGASMPTVEQRHSLEADLERSWRRIATGMVLDLRHRVRDAVSVAKSR
jgi:hypothetical protein